MLLLHAGIGITLQEEITEVTCSTNSNIITWNVNNHPISSIEGVSYTTVPANNGMVVSRLVLNTSGTHSLRSGRNVIQCCSEQQACQSIQLQHNGLCLDESTHVVSTIDRKSIAV